MPDRRTAAPATTDQTIKRSLDPEPVIEQEKKSWLDLSITQVVGGALAAMTAAALGSRFSVEGTVVGAALASVIAAVAGALYTASLRRTHDTVRVVFRGRPAQAAGMQSPSTPAGTVPGVTAAVEPRSLPSPAGPADNSARAGRRRGLVVRSLVGAAAIFALAGGALTIYEALAGHALSGGNGTTFSQVQQDRPENRPTDEQAPAPTESVEPSPTAEPTAEPTPEPTAEPSATPETEPTPPVEPSAEPTAEPSVTPETEPSATGAPPSAVPSQALQTPR